MGKVYLKTKYDNVMKMEIPHNHNFASAMFGFREMAAEIVPSQKWLKHIWIIRNMRCHPKLVKQHIALINIIQGNIFTLKIIIDIIYQMVRNYFRSHLSETSSKKQGFYRQDNFQYKRSYGLR